MLLKKMFILSFFWCPVLLYTQEDLPRFDFLQIKSRSLLGLRLGSNLAGLHYSDDMSEIYNNALFFGGVWGLAWQYSVTDNFTINPDFVLITRGQKIDDIFNYELRAGYFDLNIAFVYHLKRAVYAFRPYLAAGPAVGFIRGGTISFNTIKIDMTNANMSRFNIGIRAALGLQKSIRFFNDKQGRLFVELARHHGLTDSYSAKEHRGESVALNASDYLIQGKRYHRAWEVQVGLLAPLDIFEKPVEQPEPDDIIVEPVFEIPQKECYSVEEIVDYYQRGLDIRNLKICLFNINFEFDKSELTDDSKVYIDEIADLMRSLINLKMQINGHTDSRGSDSYNQKLSEARALAVYTYLINEAGITADRLSHLGFGESKPIDTNETDAGRATNRRVEFQVIAQ